MLALWSLLGLSASAISLSTSPSYHCTEIVVPVNVSLQTILLNLSAPANQTELTGFITKLNSETSNVTTSIMGGNTNLTASYNIWSQLCIPAGFRPNGTLEFAIHGINFDHSYWSFGGMGSKYNYVEAAVRARHAIFIYDRLGVGESSKPDGIKEVQLSTEVEIAASLVKYLRGGLHGLTFGTVIGVGHSFGSLQLVGVAAKYGNLLDATVLTGFSSYSGGQPVTLATFGLMIASKQNPLRFGSLGSSYLATEGMYNDQMNFFHYPAFEFASLELASATKGTLTLGELLTQVVTPALMYTRPVFVVTGDKDFIFCGGNCYQLLNGSANLIEQTKELFPATSNFSTYIPAETGHAVNAHFSAPQTFVVIQEWIEKLL